MSKELPFFKFYPSEWLLGKINIQPLEIQGAFIQCVCICWHNRGTFLKEEIEFRIGENNLKKLLHINLISESEGIYTIDFISEQLEERSVKSAVLADNGRLGGLAKAKQNLANGSNGLANRSRKEKKRKEEDKIVFSVFWDLYDYKTNREDCIKKWDRLSLKDQQEIINYLPAYIKSTPDKKFRKHPATFLNNKGWQDEIIEGQKEERGVNYYLQIPN